MTEAEWLACDDPEAMLDFLRGKASERKLKLFACACVRRTEVIFRQYNLDLNPVVDAQEDRADSTPARSGRVRVTMVKELKGGMWDYQRIAAQKLLESFDRGPVASSIVGEIAELLQEHANRCSGSYPSVSPLLSYPREFKAQAGLLRELFGELVQATPPQQDRVVATYDAKGIALAIYADRIFADLPILADALEDAGCTDSAILTHLRSPGPHVRGCWALDLILGKW